MTNSEFQKSYAKAWLPLAHVLGVVGNGVFIFICVYEFGILLRLWGSIFWAVVVPISLEFLQYFFAKIAAKQRIFEEQQAEQNLLNEHTTSFNLIERNQFLRDDEVTDFINRKNLTLLRGEIIPASSFSSILIHSFVFVTLIASTSIITLNRGESNQKVVDAEVITAKTVIDSIKNDVIKLKKDALSAALSLIDVDGSVSTDESAKTQSQLDAIDVQIEDAKQKKEVNRLYSLKIRKQNLTDKMGKLPLASAFDKQKATEFKKFTDWKSEIEKKCLSEKKEKETEIRTQHATKGTRISWLAIITNIIYVVLQYVILKIRTITGAWSFDLIELIATIFMRKKRLENEEKESNTIDENIEKQPIFILKKVDLGKSVNPKFHYETFRQSNLKIFWEENNIKNINGHKTPEGVWSAIKNGRIALIEGKINSKSVETMNELLRILAERFEIMPNPEETKIEKMTPNLVIRIIEKKMTKTA